MSALHNELERAYLSALMLAPHLGASAATIRVSLLEPSEVYEPQRRKALEAMHRVIDAGGVPDFVSVAAELDPDTDALEELHECAALTHLGSLPAAFAALRERALRTERTRIMAQAAESEERGEKVDEDALTSKLRELRRDQSADTLDPEALLRVAWLRLTRTDSGRDLVVRLGHRLLDDAIGGLDPGGLTVVGARPSVGKSTLALDIACRSPARTCIVSVEDPAATWSTRYASREAGVSAKAVRTGDGLTPRDFELMGLSASTARARRFHVVDCSARSALNEVRSAMRVHHKTHGSQIYVVDYAQAISVQTKGHADARERINRVIEGLKGECAQLGAHLVLMSQLRRVDDESEEPSRQDLKESGKFEEAAENILLLWRNKHGTVCGRVAKAKGGMPGLGFVLPQSELTMAFGEAAELVYWESEDDGGKPKKKGWGR